MNIQKQHSLSLGMIILSFMLLSACGGGSSSSSAQFVTPSYFIRTGVFMTAAEEATPVVWNGRLIIITGIRREGQPTSISIDDYFTKEHITDIQTPCFTTPSALVYNGTIYIFGTTGLSLDQKTWDAGNSIQVISSTDLQTWTTPVTVYTAPTDQVMFNTSVTSSPIGFVMAYEVSPASDRTQVYIHFLGSADLTSFYSLGGSFGHGVDNFATAPTIRYFNGYYYLLSTKRESGYFDEDVVRSTDLIQWQSQTASSVPLSPVGYVDESICAADLDMAEFNGKTYFVYSGGDQKSMADESLMTAEFNGTEEQYLEQFF